MAVDMPSEDQHDESAVLPPQVSNEQPRKGTSDAQRMERDLTFVS